MCRSNWVRQCVLLCLVGTAVIGLFAGSAMADLVIDARIDNAADLTAAGWTVSPDLKTATPPSTAAVGQNVVVGFYAIPGAAAGAGDQVQAAVGSVDQYAAGTSINVNGDNTWSPNVVLDTVSTALLNGFNGANSQVGMATSGVGAWVGDLPKDNNDESSTHPERYLAALNNAVQTVTNGTGLEIASATYHVGGLTQGTTGESINFVPDIDFAGSGAVWTQNGVVGDASGQTAGAAFVAGTPVTINAVAPVPEPATLVLLGMGCVGLIAVWRRK